MRTYGVKRGRATIEKLGAGLGGHTATAVVAHKHTKKLKIHTINAWKRTQNTQNVQVVLLVDTADNEQFFSRTDKDSPSGGATKSMECSFTVSMKPKCNSNCSWLIGRSMRCIVLTMSKNQPPHGKVTCTHPDREQARKKAVPRVTSESFRSPPGFASGVCSNRCDGPRTTTTAQNMKRRERWGGVGGGRGGEREKARLI